MDSVVAENLVTAELVFAPEAVASGWQRFERRLTIGVGWHINANPASLEILIPTRIEGDVRVVEYPRGTPFRPASVGEEIQVHSGRVTIPGEVSLWQPRLQLTFQACDDRRCLPPETREVSPTGSRVLE